MRSAHQEILRKCTRAETVNEITQMVAVINDAQAKLFIFLFGGTPHDFSASMKWLTSLTSSVSDASLAAKFRRRRFKLFIQLLDRAGNRSNSILDVGGWEVFWEIMGFADTKHHITLLNLEEYSTNHANIASVIGDARNMTMFLNKSFDVVFSNSVIEHLGTFDNQLRMAKEVMRVGRHYFIQTPNFYFPLEPHFLTPFFHWLPRTVKLSMHTRFDLGFYKKAGSVSNAARLVDEVRLLKPREFRSLFPEATIYHERILGMTKSFIAYA